MESLKINTATHAYPILFQPLESIGSWIKKNLIGEKYVIITDENVSLLYLSSLETCLAEANLLFNSFVIPAGESSKSLQTFESLAESILSSGITRQTVIVALGGGVVGDLAGFLSATLLRGISYIQVPTTLLSQVDSSVGGKVAINTRYGKNLIGAFYPPKAVWIDVELLKTLPSLEVKSGLAEILKIAALKNEVFFNELKLEHGSVQWADYAPIILRSCELKAEIVEKDEKEQGERILLNFGHTLGHMLEKYGEHVKLTHGQAVALGMLQITKWSEFRGLSEKGTFEKLKNRLSHLGLMVDFPHIDCEKAEKLIQSDKKAGISELSIVYLEKIGSAKVCQVKWDQITEIIKQE